MKGDRFFEDPIAIRIWNQYLKRLARSTRTLDDEQRRELELEIQDHLLQSYREAAGEGEAEKLLVAIEHLGEPEDFIKPMLASKLLSKASRTLRPRAVLAGLYFYLSGGIKRWLTGLLFGVGYVLASVLALIAVLKIPFPTHAGLLLFENGGWVFGFVLDDSHLKSDLLGYWIVPIGLGLAGLIYFVLTKLLRFLKPPSSRSAD